MLETGVYHLIIISYGDAMSYLYQDTFHPSGALTNQLLLSYKQCITVDYQIGIYFQSNRTYELIVTTPYLSMPEHFSILLVGPNNITFNHISKYFGIMSIRITVILLVNSPSVNQTMYKISFTNSSLRVDNRYYEAVQINVIKSDIYNFFLTTSADKYAYLYMDYFNPFTSAENLLRVSNIRCIQEEFNFVHILHANTTYVLVMKKDDLSEIMNFSVIASGINKVTFHRLSK